jgi:hypothetical protein
VPPCAWAARRAPVTGNVSHHETRHRGQPRGCGLSYGWLRERTKARGTWAYEDAETYVGYELKRDDTCRFIGAAKGQAGLGGYCRFERQEHTMRIVEVWGNTGPRWKLPAKFTMTYDPDTDTLTLHEGDRSIRLSRTSRLLGE